MLGTFANVLALPLFVSTTKISDLIDVLFRRYKADFEGAHNRTLGLFVCMIVEITTTRSFK